MFANSQVFAGKVVASKVFGKKWLASSTRVF
jgi:hypothetical protein